MSRASTSDRVPRAHRRLNDALSFGRSAESAGAASSSVVGVHVGTRPEHRNTTDLVPNFENDGRLTPRSADAFSGKVPKGAKIVLALTGHSGNGGKSEKTFRTASRGRVGHSFDTEGAVEHMAQLIEARGATLTGLRSGHCYGAKHFDTGDDNYGKGPLGKP